MLRINETLGWKNYWNKDDVDRYNSIDKYLVMIFVCKYCVDVDD